MGIPCQAFLYKAAEVNRPDKDRELNLEVAQLAFDLMKQRNDYVSYTEAKEILAQQKRARTAEPVTTTV